MTISPNPTMNFDLFIKKKRTRLYLIIDYTDRCSQSLTPFPVFYIILDGPRRGVLSPAVVVEIIPRRWCENSNNLRRNSSYPRPGLNIVAINFV
jgi:hypothetical protein